MRFRASKKYLGGNLNPANWIRPFSKIGHDILFRPGALDQRARIYIADLIKSQRPELSDARIAQAVNEQLGNLEFERELGVRLSLLN